MEASATCLTSSSGGAEGDGAHEGCAVALHVGGNFEEDGITGLQGDVCEGDVASASASAGGDVGLAGEVDAALCVEGAGELTGDVVVG